MQKTGGTFVESKLIEIFGPSSALKVLSKHHRESAIIPDRLRLMNIRDPINYYFSLWSYGLESKGGFFRRLSRALPAEQLRAMYGTTSKEAFDNFVRECFKPGEHDLYTQRTLRMIIPANDKETMKATVSKSIDYSLYESRLSKYTPHVLFPTEGLNQAFHAHADQGRLNPLGLPADWKAVFPLDASEINESRISRQANTGEIDRHELISPESRDVIVQRCILPRILYDIALKSLK